MGLHRGHGAVADATMADAESDKKIKIAEEAAAAVLTT